MCQTIIQALLAHGERQPKKIAVIFKENCLTYAELIQQVIAFANLLKTKMAVKAGDFVMLPAVSKPEYIIAYLGIQYLNAVSIPLNKFATQESILEAYDFFNPKVLFMDRKLQRRGITVSFKQFYQEAASLDVSKIENFTYQIPNQEDDISEILFTTGTTGKPKGAMLSYANIYASICNTRDGIGMTKKDCELVPLPLNHSFGMRVLRSLLYIGATIVLQNGFTFAKELERNICQHNCTGLVATPASLEMIYRQMQDRFAEIIGQLRFIEISAGALSYEMKKRLLTLLPQTEIHNTWGSTETGGAIFLNISACPNKLTSIGYPLETIEIKVVDENGKDIHACNADTAGRMALRGKMQMQGYYKDISATSKTLVDGWLLTNDMVYMDTDGYVYMLGRVDDIINVGGEKVSPFEVENIAQESDEIQECICIGVDDPKEILGSIPILFVIPKKISFDEKAVIHFLSSRIEKYKIPQQFLLIDEIPRNQMKKPDRKALYQIWEQSKDSPIMNNVLLALRTRRSIRNFEERKIPHHILKIIVETGIYAPSGHNMQTWRFTVLEKAKDISKLKESIAVAANRTKTYFYGFNEPSAVILITNDRRNRDGCQDSSCAAENIMLAAHSIGIGSVWINALMTINDEADIRKLLRSYNIPDTHIVWATIALGYPKSIEKPLVKNKNVIHWID